MRSILRLALSALLLLPFTTALSAQTGTVRGRVVDSGGTALSGTTVSVEGTGLRATSGTGGNYEIRGVPSGPRTLRARLIGYTAGTADVVVPPGGSVEHDFSLARSAVQLAPIDVVVGSRARHTAAEELAVPVDVFTAEDIRRRFRCAVVECRRDQRPADYARPSPGRASRTARTYSSAWSRTHHAPLSRRSAGVVKR